MAVITSKVVQVPEMVSGKMLGDYAEGDIVLLNENGSPVEFYVAKHDYESGLNGAGRTLLVRKDCCGARAWHSSNVNAYANSDIDSWLNGAYKNTLDSYVRGVIGDTKFYYTPGNGNVSVSTLSRSVFLLSVTENGQTSGMANTEGAALPIAKSIQISYYEGSAAAPWTRSPNRDNTTHVNCLGFDGSVHVTTCNNTSRWPRPCFTLPVKTLFDPELNTVLEVS